MKATGIVRKVDELGRVVIPKEIRTTMDIQDGTPLEFFVEGENIILHKYTPSVQGCVLCGEANSKVLHTHSITSKLICTACAEAPLE
jgi:transcriptional pleiotropic regulator of transition state genes